MALPGEVKLAISTLNEAGHVAYIVGGSVRDFILGLPVKDYDLVTDAVPDRVEELFPNSVSVGKAFGVIRVPFRRGEKTDFIEIATFREDGGYVDHRHPRSVRFGGPIEDARRRDFTFNGLFYDPKTRRILDCVGGIEDLKTRTLRAIGDPEERFHEDALRILRAVRFAARFQVTIEENTLKALHSEVRFTRKVSAERIRDEMTRTFQGPDPEVAYELFREIGVFSLWLPEALKVKASTLAALDLDPSPRSVPLVWALLLSEVGGEDPTKYLQGACDRMRLSGEEKKRVTDLVINLPRFNDVFQMRDATLKRWIREPFFPELLQLHRAVAIAKDGNLLPHRFCKEIYEDLKAHQPTEKLVTGEDLVSLGVRPGPLYSEILRVIEDLTLEGKLKTKDQALEYVLKYFVR